MEEINLLDIIDPPKESHDWKWSFSDYPSEKNGLTVFSCFACGGGSTMGYKLAGCEVIGCVEIDKRMNEIYVANHNPRYNFLMDIRSFNALHENELPADLFNLDILDGSPPCTPFSTTGLRDKIWGKKKKFKEGQIEQTLDDLSFEFIETIKKLKPRVFIMENVEGLLGGKAFAYVRQIYLELSKVGYHVKHFLMKGEYMGIPQARHRVFFIGVCKDMGALLDNISLTYNYAPVLMNAVLGGAAPAMRENTQQYKMLCKAIKNVDHNIKDILMREENKYSCFSDVITWLNEVGPTVTAKANIMIGDLRRKVSDEEIIHMQTFPEDYDFCGESVRYVCGMSVPPVMMKRIVLSLIEQGVFNYKLKTEGNENGENEE